jgi:hypothetical protein
MNLQVRLAVDKVILAESADRKQQLASWVADKKLISAHAMDLQQLDNGVIVPPNGWKCSKCDKTENLWLNLTDGMILCGRKVWDGSGGNNHAVEHYQQTKYPLAVKLGTITADLEGAGNATLELLQFWNCYFHYMLLYVPDLEGAGLSDVQSNSFHLQSQLYENDISRFYINVYLE